MPPLLRASNSILDLVGETPVVRLARIRHPDAAEVLLKLEHFNPTGSHKDRIAARILEHAESGGRLKPGGTVVEASCGAFAVSLALVCAVRRYRLIAVLPKSVTREHRDVLKAYGATIELTPSERGIAGALTRAREIADGIPGSYSPSQYTSKENEIGHAEGEGEELRSAARQLTGSVDAFVMSVGTGGSMRGVREALRQSFPKHLAIAVVTEGQPSSPSEVPLPSDIGVDRTMIVSSDAALKMKQRLAREEGLLVGPTSGANVAAALDVALELGPGKAVYTLSCDTGERYFSLDE
jgi:cysteine synthase A